MSTQNLIIYKFSRLYQILEDLSLDLNFNIFFENNVNLLPQFPRNKYIINKFIEIAITLDKEHWIVFFNIINQANESEKQDFKEKLFALSEQTNDKKFHNFILINTD